MLKPTSAIDGSSRADCHEPCTLSRSRARFLCGLLAFLALTPLSRSQVDGALVTRRGALVQGTVEGALVALGETAEVTVDRGALVTGDLVLPAEKKSSQPGAGDHGNLDFAPGRKVSPLTKLTLSDPTTVKGHQRTTAGFELPKTAKPRKPDGTDKVVLQTDKDKEPDFKKLRDLTLKDKKRDVTLPPGSYGDIVIESGRLLLGQKGVGLPTRYYFQSLSVGANASVEPLGRTVVVVGQLGAIQGMVGSSRFTNWLDLRVAGGDVALGADSEIHGVVTAVESAVTLGPRAKLRGGLICDQAVVGSTARFTGVSPGWSKESSGSSLPLFIHKAARIESQLSELAERCAGSYVAAVSYPNDEPLIALQPDAGTQAPPAQEEEQRAFFDACRTLFDGTGFSRGIVQVFRTANPQSAPEINVLMEREQFEDHLWAIGRQKEPRDNIVRIRDNPKLLNLFMARSLKVAFNAASNP